MIAQGTIYEKISMHNIIKKANLDEKQLGC